MAIPVARILWTTPGLGSGHREKTDRSRTTFHYTVVRLTKLAHQLEERGVPVEGWIHFSVTGVHEREIGATIYRLIVLTPNGGNTADLCGTKKFVRLAGSPFQKIPVASHVLYD